MIESHNRLQNIILAIDSSGAQLSLALARGKQILASRSLAARFGQGERLFTELQSLMAEPSPDGIDFSQIAAVAVTEGPGSFTGIRTGMAAARGLALALAIPTIGISSFKAYQLAAVARLAVGTERIMVVIESRRDALYAQEFRLNPAGEWQAELAFLATAAEVRQRIESAATPTLVTGDVAELVADWSPIDIALVAGYGAGLWSRGVGKVAEPFYLRPPDVSQPKNPPRVIDFAGDSVS